MISCDNDSYYMHSCIMVMVRVLSRTLLVQIVFSLAVKFYAPTHLTLKLNISHLPDHKIWTTNN